MFVCFVFCIYAGKPNLKLALNTCDQAVIHELTSPSPVQTPSSGASSQSTVTCPQSPESDTFHWPDVQELRSKYTSSNRMQGCCMNRCTGCSHMYNSCTTLTDCPSMPSSMSEDWTQPQSRPQLQPPLCRWNSLDHMLGSLPLHEVQNLQDPVRSCYTSSQVSLISKETPSKLQDGDPVLQESLDCPTKSPVLSSGKVSESNLVKSLREKFQSLSTSSWTWIL